MSNSTVVHTACGKSTLDCTCPPYYWVEGKRFGGCSCASETCATAFEFVLDWMRIVNAQLRSIESKLSTSVAADEPEPDYCFGDDN